MACKAAGVLVLAAAIAGSTQGEAASAGRCPARDDYFVRSDPTLAPVRPADCSVVAQTPPEFTWPPQEGRNRYELILTFPDGHQERQKTALNWVLWPRELPPGEYAWQVKVSGAQHEASEPRVFTIAPGATSFVVPPGEVLARKAAATPHPRTWSRDAAQLAEALRRERAPGFQRLRGEVESHAPTPVQPEPDAASENANYDATVGEQKRTLAAAFAWAMTRQPRYGEDAVRRILAQARWSTTGAIAYKRNDMANRNVAWTLALAYDWTHDYLQPAQKAAVLAAIRARTQPMFEDVTARLHAYPFDSHGNITLTLVAAIGALTVGDIPEAERWVREAVPLAAVWTSPWGWRDGGFANGTAQLFWDVGSLLPAWYVLRNATGVDFARKEWVRNVARFMAYFVPPGAPAGVFGDGHEIEMQETWARIAKAAARFAPEPLALWYANSFAQEDPARIELMVSPRVELEKASLPANAPNAAYFPSVGWVAMHSRLDDPRRTSIYFKSSPYGSYNHGHADQNAFVIHHRGEALAIASGYYDGYQTPHWKQWYKQTRAANAITFDGGQGQGFNEKRFSGEITRFETTAAYDLATGHAQAAYDGALTRAQRSIVYLRPNVVLVHDRLAAETPRTWEWNLHTLRRMTPFGDRAVQVQSGEARMCVEILSAPPVAFRQSDQFTAPPANAKAPSQWHGAFVTTSKSDRADFVVLMRLDAECGSSSARAVPVQVTDDAVRVDIDGSSVTFASAGATVQRRSSALAKSG